MRILFWQEALAGAGGVQTHAAVLLPALRARGHEIVVVTRDDTGDQAPADRWNGVAVRRFPFWQALHRAEPRAVLALQREVGRLCEDVNPAVIHLNGFGPTALFALQAQRARHIPLLAALHSANTLAHGGVGLLQATLSNADWVSACSRALLDAARAAVPAIVPYSSVIYNGVPMPATPAAPPPARPCVLCLGQLAHHKGYDLVLRAAPHLLARFPALRIVIAGDGPDRDALERLARSAGVVAAVEFPGAVSRAAGAELINGATVVAVPSRRESFSLVAVEAAWSRRPVVATRIGGLPEVVAHGETGLLVAPDDAEDLAAAIRSLLDDPARAARMGTVARARAARLFALETHREAYEDIYRRIGTALSARAPGAEVGTRCE